MAARRLTCGAREVPLSDSANIVPAGADTIRDAAAVLRRGGLVAFPTETVYGLGADATNEAALATLFAAKGRPRFNPLIIHVADLATAQALAPLGETGQKLAHAFWPGPLTLVVPRPKESRVGLLASAGLDTLALRVPAHPVAQALLRAFGGPIAAPSANPSGRVTSTRASDVAEELGSKVHLIVDGGACPVGIESTIIDVTGARPVLLRPGGVARDAIEAVVGPLASPSGDGVKAPGMLKSHYAPRLKLRLDVMQVKPGEALLAFGPHPLQGAVATLNLSERGDLAEAAAHLFAHLRALDASPAQSIAVMAIPREGLGEAINDRLARAAAPREA